MATVSEICSAIQAALPAPRREITVDRLLAGDPAAEVARIAVVTVASVAALRAAIEAGANLIVTHEPLYFNHHDAARESLQGDEVFEAKRALVEGNRLNVFHLHDQVHDLLPDQVDAATATELGWALDVHPIADGPPPASTATIAPITLGALAAHIATTLRAPALRYLGDPGAMITRVGLDLGFRGFDRNRALLSSPDVDVAIVGEIHEWETGGYAADAVGLGIAKGLIVVGHLPSEAAITRWLSAWLPEALAAAGFIVPVTCVDLPDPLHAR